MKKRNLIILLVLLAVLAASYIYISKRPSKTKDQGSDTQAVKLLELDSKKIVKINIKNKDGILELEKKNDKWALTSEGGINIDQNIVDTIVSTFSALNADKIVSSNPGNLGEYGLSSPSSATAILEDGSEKVVYVGDKTPDGNNYYGMVKGDPKVYLLSSADGQHLMYTVADIRNKDILTKIDSEKLNYIKIVRNNKTIELKKNDEKAQTGQAQLDSGWNITQPYSRVYGTDSEKLSPVLDALGKLTVSDVVEDKASDLGKYGLDKPSMEIMQKDDKNTLDIYFGKDVDDSYIYFSVKGLDGVYKMSKSNLDALNIKPFDVTAKFAYIVSIDDVDKITIESGGKTDTAVLTRTTKKAEKSGDKDEVVTTYTLNGKNADEDKFKDLYQKIIGLIVDSENDKNVPQKPEVKITFFLNKGTNKQVVTEYCPYNSDFYAVYRDGKADFLISRDKVSSMINAVRNFK
ncbi:MAG TPA: hypothetical protein DD426_06060 [Clostridiaceae bacterium]|nr:hypothetical protein [Clostridiaceae bacterium]